MAMASREDGDFEQIDWRGKVVSEAEYRKLELLSPDRKYEYINGRVYMMSGGSVAHDLLSYNMRVALNLQLRSGPCRVFGPDVQVLLGKKTNGKPHFVYPDTTISCNADDRLLDNTLVESPRVVVEVLSPGTETKDRGIKFRAYQHCQTIQEIVLVNQYFPSVEVWQRNEEHPENPNAWLYRRYYGPDEIVRLTSLNLQLTMADIYQDLHFEQKEDDDEA
jgi:Uma2 family endonuclease